MNRDKVGELSGRVERVGNWYGRYVPTKHGLSGAPRGFQVENPKPQLRVEALTTWGWGYIAPSKADERNRAVSPRERHNLACTRAQCTPSNVADTYNK